MDECIRVVKSVVVLLMIVCAIGCREMKENSLNIPNGRIVKVQFINEDRVLVESSDSLNNSSFINAIAEAKIDSTDVDFKSFNFIKFLDTDGNSYRIEIFKNRFRFNGKRYLMNFDIKQKFDECFKNP